jgi:DNA modification methylase
MTPEKAATVTLWGDIEEPFAKAIDRFGVWPLTVWDCDLSDPATKRLKAMVGDSGASRHGGFMSGGGVYGGKVKVTIFNPAVASWLLNMYAPPLPAAVYDPFAGGGTRAIIAAAKGLSYFGAELRREEVEASLARVAAAGFADSVHIEEADAMDPPFAHGSADLLLTCPPYWNLERYGGGDNDLSEATTYEEFLDMLYQTIDAAKRILKPGAKALWVVGLHRDIAGGLLPLHHDVARLHRRAGFLFKEEIILAQRNNGAIQRIGNFERGDRRLVRTHEYALVFVKPFDLGDIA